MRGTNSALAPVPKGTVTHELMHTTVRYVARIYLCLLVLQLLALSDAAGSCYRTGFRHSLGLQVPLQRVRPATAAILL